jgi:aminopeptidase N
MKLKLFILIILSLPFFAQGQEKKFTHADTLRGSLNENRDWWDVLRYDIEVKPDYESKTIEGKCNITFKVKKKGKKMQIDFQEPMLINEPIVFYGLIDSAHKDNKVAAPQYIAANEFRRIEQSYIIDVPEEFTWKDRNYTVEFKFTGKPKEAKNPPWDGGWIWKKDSLNRPWMSVAVQGLGASAWYPCKDYQGDEPDSGASLTIIVPDTLVAVGNGRLKAESLIPNSQLRSFTWEVKNPINNYNIVPYIGKYVNWSDTLSTTLYSGFDPFESTENPPFQRTFKLDFWVLDYNLEKAKRQFEQVKPMLRCFQYWFGPYPFYEDGYKLVDAPHLGMEHQSAVAYGNGYKNGYRGRDLSGTGWGLKWDFIIVHESGHEWFANNITTKDIADMWVHEGFTNYSETLYTEWLFGKQAGDEYNFGIRRNIRNDIPIIGQYGVNNEGSGDMYYKAGNMIHIIRKVINNDDKFRQVLRGLNATFWHQTVTTKQIENYINKESGIDFQKTFDQYLRTTQIPQLEFKFSKDKKTVSYRWTNCVDGFDLPLVINNKRYNPTTKWNSSKLINSDLSAWDPEHILKQYYITAKQVKP